MICPKCQNEVNDTAKFCTKCGCDLAKEMKKQEAKTAPPQIVCAKCGASLALGTKFCTKCGCNLTEQTVNQTVNQPVKTVPLQIVCVKCGASLTPGTKFCTKCGTSTAAVPSSIPATPPPAAASTPAAAVPSPSSAAAPTSTPVAPAPIQREKVEPPIDKAEKPKKKSKKGVIAAIVIVFVLLAASAVAATGYFIYNGTIELPAFALDDDTEEEEQEKAPETEETEETKSRAVSEAVDANTLFAEADALLEEGKEKITIDAEIINGMDVIEDAIHQFVEKAEESGNIDIAQERIADAYSSYVSAVIRYKEMLNGQTLSGNIYSQILSEMEKAEVLADELTDKGFPIDDSYLETEKEEFISQYNDRMITTFNEFTQREMWSRTEAWNLMADADKMFEASDVDNPLRLRYAYALAWWIQKQIETELNNGTITQKGAAIKIANSIKDMDYNPMMLYYYIYYMKEAGEDCAEVEMAYNKIVDHIYDTQGIRIGEDFDLQHFWYFNDFGEYSVDDTNGVTPENRQWIRDYMETVAFVKN